MKLLLCIFALVAAAMSDTSLEEVLKSGNDQFTANMFQEVVGADAEKSCVLSAFSVLSPLAQLGLASVGDSHDEILRAIGFPNDDVTKQVFTDVNNRLRSVQGVTLKQASKIYVKNGLELNDDYKKVSRDVFDSEVQNIDFSKQDASAKQINAWVEDHTNNRIKDLVDPQAITPNTQAILVNAIYFKGSWVKKFEVGATSDRDFYVTKDKKVPVKMMYQSDDFNYCEDAELDAKFLEMKYEGNDTSLVIALPNKVDGVNDLIKKFKDPAVLNNALKNMYNTEVEVSLPRFKIETTTNLKNVLEKMNIKKLFQAGEAKLNNLIKNNADLYVSDATQKAFIEVNEEGAEAAAANAFAIVDKLLLIRILPKFKADHPFVFFLKENNLILFSGVFRS
ncbi:alaserpin-like isoform X6 [Anticarsia gemmatalis]|uniref:alaserpin-like isoform X6 n=1 Tax=Anticarsia gemmatalis TaxID=129554 RepID=UPI003F7699E5